MAINKNEITKEMLEKAMQCNTAEDLIAQKKCWKKRCSATLRKI